MSNAFLEIAIPSPSHFDDGHEMTRQAGFSMIEFMLVILLLTLAGVWGAGEWARQMEDEAADATSSWMTGLHQGLEAFLAARMVQLTEHADQLKSQSKLNQGLLFAQPDRPTVPELRRSGFLPAAFPDLPPHAGAFGIALLPSADCAESHCHLEAIAWVQPLSANQSQKSMLHHSSRILSGLRGKGLVVSPLAPNRVKGSLGDFPNPPVLGLSPWPVGSVSVIARFTTQTEDRHVRRMDSRATHLKGELATDAGFSAAHIRSKSAIESQGRLTAGEYLMLRGRGQSGQPCAEDGLIARGDAGGLLICEQGRWQGQESGFGGAYAVNNYDHCGQLNWNNLPWWRRQSMSVVNPKTGQCSCPSGYQAVKVSAGGDQGGPSYWTTGYVCVR